MLETILKYFSTTNSARHFQHDNLSTIQFQTAVPRAEIACYTWSMRSSTRTISARGQSQTATPECGLPKRIPEADSANEDKTRIP